MRRIHAQYVLNTVFLKLFLTLCFFATMPTEIFFEVLKMRKTMLSRRMYGPLAFVLYAELLLPRANAHRFTRLACPGELFLTPPRGQ